MPASVPRSSCPPPRRSSRRFSTSTARPSRSLASASRRGQFYKLRQHPEGPSGVDERHPGASGPDPERLVYELDPFRFQGGERRLEVLHLERHVVEALAPLG